MHSNRAFQKLLIASAAFSVAHADLMTVNGHVIGQPIDDFTTALGAFSVTPTTSAKADSQTAPTSQPPAPVPITTTTKPPPPEVVVVPTTSNNTPAVVKPSNTPSVSIPTTGGGGGGSPTPIAGETAASSAPQSTSFSFKWTPTASEASSFISATPVISTKVEVITQILSNGSKAVVTTTTRTTSTPAPGLSSDEGETTGMTTKTRNTVIGVVVGVGGSIVLGALALVAWRIWGRRRRGEEHDVLMDYDLSTPGAAEKSERGSSAGGPQRTPFQSTLENYHQPTQANPSSNF
ncbi:hypothetical protein E4U60_006918 [Claviceps pazoutovae]|uniref:Mid2 domain-containing protein n=1 Tax=Claviceps pazoutovae TaxID=1649127 RepID=A0A9P7SHV4_9HYPO|nr:hypothetical protein E4U60_006918 [Claviceps pazoutovae]